MYTARYVKLLLGMASKYVARRYEDIAKDYQERASITRKIGDYAQHALDSIKDNKL